VTTPLPSVKPWVWAVLVGSLALLLGALLLSSSEGSWLSSDQLNPLMLRSLPERWQVADPWRDVGIPLGLALAVSLGVRVLPHRPWAFGLLQLVMLIFALRYFLWRFTTLNTAHPLSLTCSAVLLGCELVYLLTFALQLVPSLAFDPGQRRRQADQLERDSASEPNPSIDIWIPTYNESERLVRRAVLTCRNLRGQGVTITVLDDGHRPSIARMANDLGVNYLSRADNAHRKAGNLNHALAHTTGDLIAVFDCDFMPFPQFLERTIGFFRDPKLAMVQTPQHYFQPDFHNRNLGIDRVMPSDLDYFFRYLQVIRDRFNAVICCGTSYVVRRTALESIGGYVTSCLIEDHQTSTKLLTRGWRIAYLSETLSLGEQPRTFADYVDQRLRWMQGNIEIFLLPGELPIWRRLNGWQKSFYINLLFSLLTPLFRVVYLALPLLSLMLGFTLIAAPPVEYLAYGIPFVLLLYTVPSWLSNYHHFQFWNEVYESLFAFPALVRMVQILRKPFRVIGSIVTAKDTSSDRQSLNLELAWPLVGLLGMLVTTLLVRYGLPALNPDALPNRPSYEGEGLMLAWNIYNGWLILVSLLACIDPPLRPGDERFPLQLIGKLTLNGQSLWGHTQNLSESGAGLRLSSRTASGTSLQPGDCGSLELVESGLCLPVRLDTVDHDGSPVLELGFPPLTSHQTGALLELIYDGRLPMHQPHRIGTLDALIELLGSIWRAVPLVQRR